MPHPLLQRVVQLAERARRVALWAAVGRVAAVAAGVALVLMVADYVVRLSDPGMRWLSAGLLLAAVAVAGYRWLAGADWRRHTTLTIAQQIQVQQPTLGSRLASAIEFLQQPSDDPTAGSADLRRAVVIEATSQVERLDLNQVVDRRPLARALRWLAACFAIAVAFGVADLTGLKTAAARLVAPWSDLNWPRRNHLTVVEAPDRIARGQAFEASVADAEQARLPADLRVQYRTRVGGKVRVEEQALPAAASRATVHRENVQQAFEFRVAGGDDDSMPWRAVEVVDPPRLAALAVRAAPPAYSGLPAAELREEDRVLAGSAVTIEGAIGDPVASAELVVGIDGEEQPFPLAIEPGSPGEPTALRLGEPWRPEPPAGDSVAATYRVRVTSVDGLQGQSKPRLLTIVPDSVPTLEWIEPSGSLLVTARAIVPLRVLAEDNLAIAKAELLWRRDEEAAPESEPDPGADAEPAEAQPANADAGRAETNRVEIYAGPAEPPARPSLPWDTPADSRELSYELLLEPLALEAGDQLALLVEAADYRPGVGVTPLPRRVTIISDEEFDSRLAQLQSELVQDLKRLLGEQREARQGAGELRIDRQAAPESGAQTLDRLAGLGFQQNRVNQGVTDQRRGAAAQAEQILDELARNQQQRPELSQQLESLRDELRGLADGALATAGRDLADARRAAQRAIDEANDEAEQELDRSLADATGRQDESIEALEGMVDRMASWSDFQRFAQELGELEREQRELREQTLKEAARAAAQGANNPERAAQQAKLRAAQAEVARRFGKLQDAMRKAADQSAQQAEQEGRERSDAEQALRDALAESRDRATRGKLEEADRQLRMGQLGRSASEQESGADDLRDMLETLRDRAASDPEQLAEQLRDAQEKLAELQRQLDKLTDDAEKPAQQLERQKLADKTERMSRRLDRLKAPDAAQSAQQGAGGMQESAEQGEEGRQSLAQAQEDLQQAQEQLAERIRQQEQLQALKVLDRLAARMDGYIQRQTDVLERTVGAEQEQQAAAGADLQATIEELAHQQHELREDVDVSRRDVAQREVFELALRRAVADMDQAHEQLAGGQVGRPAQQREHAALQRLKHIADALKLNPPPQEDQPPPPPPAGGGGGGQPPPPSPVDVAELKMLRLMQLDLNADTRTLEADAAGGQLDRAKAAQRAEQLSTEQERLGQMVRELLERINKRQAPGEPPDDAV